MKSFFTSTMLLLLMTCGTTYAQRKTVKAGTNPARNTEILPPKPTPAGYIFKLRIKEGPKLFVSVETPEAQGSISPMDLTDLLGGLTSGTAGFDRQSTAVPHVEVEADPNVTMLDFWNPLTLFRLDRSEITVVAGETRLKIARGKDEMETILVKPNPLFLFVTIDDANNLSLNNESAGTLSDPKPLGSRLQNIFKERETNGVFREGTNDLETAVTIVMPMSDRKFSDLVKVADTVRNAGSRWVELAMELDPAFGPVDERKPILDLPTAPPRKKPRKNR
jgi:hypothetical protein